MRDIVWLIGKLNKLDQKYLEQSRDESLDVVTRAVACGKVAAYLQVAGFLAVGNFNSSLDPEDEEDIKLEPEEIAEEAG